MPLMRSSIDVNAIEQFEKEYSLNRLPREDVSASYLEVFKARLDGALRNPIS